MWSAFSASFSVQRRPSLYQATLHSAPPNVPRVNPHTVDESATFILFRLLAVLVEVESALFLAAEPLVANRGCDRRWISPRSHYPDTCDRFGFCRGLNDDKSFTHIHLPNLILPGMRRTLINLPLATITDMDSLSADINPLS